MIRVLIVDDSALIRQVLTQVIDAAPDIRVIGAVGDAYAARDFIRKQPPDVITLDIEMPRMDGLSFLQKLMKARPTPVVMVSTLTEEGADATMRALSLGAVDFVAKPKIDIKAGLSEYQAIIQDKIRAAAISRPKAALPDATVPLKSNANIFVGTEQITAIGASTGGTEAIKALLQRLPPNGPGTVIAQHMPAGFTQSYAARLNRECAMTVKEAEHDERILPGHAYLAPGNYHLRVVRYGADYRARLDQSPPVSQHRPSVDVLFESVAEACGVNAVGVILTGMGKDGATGLLSMRRAGALTLGQDEASCVVYGMPGAACALGAVSSTQTLPEMAETLLTHWAKRGAGNRV
ncbi:protein-glutamate methylesterase/protein-glutamine glutaminase [Reinekea blandensis]|uniref:Protein-glutamate methylesterase/protein-glutamine glutaminase n=1 Tax=Reinekea blandensis MED297 TaxID=314283 RepID=A4BJG8_9GAMM|nr:chemotaxis response regulator protein-glutamate methylesterase [Reinekea blandensis]EAR07740.1 chemotaxis-specific methylesterase [Reinekea sp. MED297] [Reinekea blandensis MED297]